MDAEKTKETAWTIHIGETNQKIKIRYKENKGVIHSILFGIADGANSISLQMSPIEFHKIYLILKAFRDLIESSGDLEMNPPYSDPQTTKISLNKEELIKSQDSPMDEWEPW
ncbi:MAG: hypothetical protein JW776_02725 [Candidatus Lokiarchaeota archaeon]|nr:hypothetical protein [Candidatus Lokiarchaeota archaeon]